MTRDEIRGLIGAYATGSLTEAERKILFEAALEDQELFDQLAQEQALKEAIETPGARARLLSALERAQPRTWWKASWLWATAAAASVAVIAGIVLLRSSVKVEEEARLEPTELPAPVPPSIAAPAPQAPALPAPVQPRAAPEPKAAVPKQAEAEPESQAKVAVAAQAAITEKEEVAAATDNLAAIAPRQVPAAAAPSPVTPPVVQSFAANGIATGTGPLVSPAAQAPVPAAVGAVGGGVGGGGGGGGGGGRGRGAFGGARALAQVQAAPMRIPFAFDYSVTPEGGLRITAASDGFLSVFSQHDAASENLFYNRRLQAGSSADIPLPANATAAMVIFSVREVPEAPPAVTPQPGASAGHMSDPNATSASSLVVLIPLKH